MEFNNYWMVYIVSDVYILYLQLVTFRLDFSIKNRWTNAIGFKNTKIATWLNIHKLYWKNKRVFNVIKKIVIEHKSCEVSSNLTVHYLRYK